MWFTAYLFLFLNSLIGFVLHGFHLPDKENIILWIILYLLLGLMLGCMSWLSDMMYPANPGSLVLGTYIKV